jgi:hypothetical protein
MSVSVQGQLLPQALALSFTLRTPDLANIRVPPRLPACPADGLWQHTCFEVFIAATAQDTYREYNLSPSGQWARYIFCSERVRDRGAEQAAPVPDLLIRCEVQADHLVVQTELPTTDLPAPLEGWTVGFTAVIEDTNGRLRHWALHHPRSQPDFHHPAGRVLRLTPHTLS